MIYEIRHLIYALFRSEVDLLLDFSFNSLCKIHCQVSHRLFSNDAAKKGSDFYNVVLNDIF